MRLLVVIGMSRKIRYHGLSREHWPAERSPRVRRPGCEKASQRSAGRQVSNSIKYKHGDGFNSEFFTQVSHSINAMCKSTSRTTRSAQLSKRSTLVHFKSSSRFVMKFPVEVCATPGRLLYHLKNTESFKVPNEKAIVNQHEKLSLLLSDVLSAKPIRDSECRFLITQVQ